MNEYRSATGTRRIGLFGGTFDPIHYGHLVIAEEVRATLNLTEIVFIPTGQPPHKPGRTIAPAQHRVAMVELAIASNPRFSLSYIEVDRSGLSYTADTVRLLREQWGNDSALYYIIGWDMLEELHTWHNPQGIVEQLTHLVAVRRPGYGEEPEYSAVLEEQLPGITQRLIVVSAPQLEIAATDLRQRVSEGRPIRYQTPEAVERYIAEQHLYEHFTSDDNSYKHGHTPTTSTTPTTS